MGKIAASSYHQVSERTGNPWEGTWDPGERGSESPCACLAGFLHWAPMGKNV